MNANERKIVLITRHTRLEELLRRYHTLGQARFYIEHLGADFADYLRENEAYVRSLRQVVDALQAWGRYQLVERTLVANYCFGDDDIVVVLGQDGLVANTLKYLNGQPVIGINPEPQRWDGVLLPFAAADLKRLLPEVARERRALRAITMAQAALSDGQVLRAVNDLFIGPQTHTSALYDITFGGRSEAQSSSGVIVSTGLGSTAWLKSVVTGSIAIARAEAGEGKGRDWQYRPLPWDAPQLVFAVREPFPSRSSQARLVYGHVNAGEPLRLRSRMADNGVIFSDGMHLDYLAFNAGMEAVISLAPEQGRLVV